MRIAYVTAGAGTMVCGSCLRDNTLAAALIDAGHNVLLIPAYTPTVTDERNVSMRQVFLGGINIYLQHHYRLFRKMPALINRMLDAPALLRLAAKWSVSVEPAELGALTVSMLQGAEGALSREVSKLVDFIAELAPDVVNIPNSLLISLASAIKRKSDVPVCCTLQGEDLFLNGLREPYRSESLRWIRKHSASVDSFLAVSSFAAIMMSEYLGIDAARIRVVPLGIDLRGFDRRQGSDPEPFTIGYLARIAPEKGLRELCEAYHCLRQRPEMPPSRLCAAGYLGPENRRYFAGIQKQLATWGLAGEFKYHGELDRAGKIEFLKSLSVLSVPAPYKDPKGLFLLEAAAAGVPVVQPRHGGFTEIVETTRGGILVEPGKPEHLADGLYEIWQNAAKRRQLAAAGYEQVRIHYGAAQMAEKAVQAYSSVLRSGLAR